MECLPQSFSAQFPDRVPLNPMLTDVIRLSGQQNSGSLLPLPFQCRDNRSVFIKKKTKTKKQAYLRESDPIFASVVFS